MDAAIVNAALNDLGRVAPVITIVFGGLLALLLTVISRGNRERASATAQAAPAIVLDFADLIPYRPHPRAANRNRPVVPRPVTAAPASPHRISRFREVRPDGSVWSLTADGDWIQLSGPGTGFHLIPLPDDEAA